MTLRDPQMWAQESLCIQLCPLTLASPTPYSNPASAGLIMPISGSVHFLTWLCPLHLLIPSSLGFKPASQVLAPPT